MFCASNCIPAIQCVAVSVGSDAHSDKGFFLLFSFMYFVYSALHPFFHLLIHIHFIKQQFQQLSLQAFNDRIITKYCKNQMQQLLQCNFQYHLGICLTGLTS